MKRLSVARLLLSRHGRFSSRFLTASRRPLPNVTGEHVTVADHEQEALKPECVRKGLMIGQFHPLSTEPGARNPRGSS